MALNRDFIGRAYSSPTPYEVSRLKIKEFAAAIGDANPIYRDTEAAKAAGHPDVVAPPTFPIVFALSGAGEGLNDPAFGLDWAMVVHGEQRFTYDRPIYAGDKLLCTSTISEIRSVGAQRVRDRPRRRHHARRRARLHQLQRHRRAWRGEVAMGATVKWDEVEQGQELPPAEYHVERVNLVMYAGASGDFNPIHWNERFAKSVGLPDVIAHGMYTMAQGGRYVTDWAGDPAAVVDYGVRFSSMVGRPRRRGGRHDQRLRPHRGEASRQAGDRRADRQVGRRAGAVQGQGGRPARISPHAGVALPE